MLEFVNALMKFAHAKNGFICDYIVVVKFYKANLYKMYGDSNTSFQATNLLKFIDVVVTYLVGLCEIG
jgi:hypothetical protein